MDNCLWCFQPIQNVDTTPYCCVDCAKAAQNYKEKYEDDSEWIAE